MSKQTTLAFPKITPNKRPLDEDDQNQPSKSSPLEKSTKIARVSSPSSFDVSTAFARDVEPKVIQKNELDLLVFKGFLKAPGRQQLTDWLLSEMEWYRVTYPTRGQTIVTPRWTTVFGCDETNAHSSNYKIQPKEIPPVLNELKEYVEERTNARYNFVLVNYYENGSDSISWHSDDEKFLGPLPSIASLSLGAPRDFMMKHKDDKSIPVEKWTLTSGDMILMRGTTQSRWLHTIPKRKEAQGRINITFRRAMSVAGTNNYYRYNVGTGPATKGRPMKANK